jgi:Flp pilus assembly protein TadD
VVHQILATAALCAMAASSQTAPDPLEQALRLLNSGNYEQSRSIVSGYLSRNPESAAAHKIFGMDEFMLNHAEDAIREMKRATELNGSDSDAFYYLGRLYFSVDNPLQALSAFRRALELDPSSVRACNHLGQTYEALARPQEAEQAYLKAIALEIRQPKRSEWPYYNLGLLYLNQGRTADAVPLLKQALERSPAMVEANVKLGLAMVNTHQDAEAEKLFSRALALDPQNAEAHYRLGRLLVRMGRQQEGASHLALFERYRKK